jgi:2-haloacid dehalogenase
VEPVSRPQIHAVVFDTFGTVVDWRGGMIAAIERWATNRELKADWAELVDEWRTCEDPGKQAARASPADWKTLEEIHEAALDPLLRRFGLEQIAAFERAWLLRTWSLGVPWPDSIPGLTAIKRRVPIASLSNGSMAQMIRLTRAAGLPWDCIFSAELFRQYKPAPAVYLGACRYLGVKPEHVLLCAAHNYDLAGAKEQGLRTAFIPRPAEFGPRQRKDYGPEGEWTFVIADLVDLAQQLQPYLGDSE